jgi:hypothetical protein
MKTTDHLESGTFLTITQMKFANASRGHHFFEPATMRWHNSRILSRVYAGRLFVTSERREAYCPRLYTIRAMADDGAVFTVGEFQQYSTRRRAIAAARAMAEDILAREVAEMDAAEVAAGAW